VRFASPLDARRAAELLNGRVLCGQALDVRLAAPPGPYRGAPLPDASSSYADATPSPNLYIKGLPPGTTDVGLRNVFAPFGVVTDSRILYPLSTAPSALLRYATLQEAAAAIAAMHGVTPPGATNTLQVRYAESPADKARRAAQVGRPVPAGALVLAEAPGGRIPPPSVPSGMEAVERVECPPSLVGWLIGRGGETIKGLQARSGCAITIDQSVAEGQPRIVQIAGSRDQVTLGRQLVEELLASGSARAGGGGGGSGGSVGGTGGWAGGGGSGGGSGAGGGAWAGGGSCALPAALPPLALMPAPAAPAPPPSRPPEPEEADPSTPVSDGAALEAARVAAAEYAGSLPAELLLQGAPLRSLAVEAQRCSRLLLPHPTPLGGDSAAVSLAALYSVLGHWQQFEQPPAAAADVLSALLHGGPLVRLQLTSGPVWY
jgi:uncharacterized membrane protein YgcG